MIFTLGFGSGRVASRFSWVGSGPEMWTLRATLVWSLCPVVWALLTHTHTYRCAFYIRTDNDILATTQNTETQPMNVSDCNESVDYHTHTQHREESIAPGWPASWTQAFLWFLSRVSCATTVVSTPFCTENTSTKHKPAANRQTDTREFCGESKAEFAEFRQGFTLTGNFEMGKNPAKTNRTRTQVCQDLNWTRK